MCVCVCVCVCFGEREKENMVCRKKKPTDILIAKFVYRAGSEKCLK